MDSEGSDSDIVDEQCKLKKNPAWADAIKKVLVLKKPKSKRGLVLSKAKIIVADDDKEKERFPEPTFEIVGEKTKIDTEEYDERNDTKPVLEKKPIIREYTAKGRIKPSILEKERERTLVKIATKGVVQLFNAVREQQKTVDNTLKKAGKSRRNREKVLNVIDKKKFLDVLTGSIKSTPMDVDVVKPDEKDEPEDSWNVLSDNFMMGTKLKDWDKQEE